MTPGPESVHFGTRPGIPARISGHRRGDHLRRCGAGGHLHRPGCAPAGPALAYDIGPTIRWPSSKLATTGQQVPKTRAATPRTRPPADAMTTTNHASAPK
jgi:hypothetical protein